MINKMVKALLILCASAFFVQAITAQCIGYNNGGIGCNNAGIGYNAASATAASNIIGGCGYGAIASPYVSTNGGGLGVSTASAVAPAGITIVSENYIEGLLDVVGSLPLIASVALEGTVPSGGAVSTSYSCGEGSVGISADSLAAAGLGGYGPGLGSNYAAANLGANYATANLGAAITGAEIAALNGARIIGPGASCGCGLY